MDELTAFERQIGDELRGEIGAVPPFDALAVARMTVDVAPRSRFRSMITGTRFVVAGAIVALFGGILLAGLLTQPSDEAVPAAVTGSPAPVTPEGLLPGVDLVTEEVEPGVYRVLSDGTDNDMGFGERDQPAYAKVVAGQDGSVWVHDRGRLFRLGLAGSIEAAKLRDDQPDISVAPDGVVWGLGRGDDWAKALFSLAEGAWTEHEVPEGVMATGVETPADGTVWATWAVRTGEKESCWEQFYANRLSVARLVDGEWHEEGVEPATLAGDGGNLAIGPDGTILLGTSYHNSCPGRAWTSPLEHDGDRWVPSVAMEPDANTYRSGVAPIVIGKDGTAWAYAVDDWDEPRLLRRTVGDWERFGDDESVPLLVGSQLWNPSMTVSNDGRLWVAFDHPEFALDDHRRALGGRSFLGTLDGACPGVISFDGVAWEQHLPGACARHVSAAPDGNVWVTVVEPADLAAWARGYGAQPPDPERAPPGLYIITPEAVAAAR